VSLTVPPGQVFEAVLSGAPTGLTGTIGVRLLDNVGGTTTARTTSGIIEYPASSGQYSVQMTAPATAGQYSIFWDNGTTTPTTTASEDLIVSYSAGSTGTRLSGDLVSLSQAREFLQKQSVDTSQDSVLQNVVSRASVAIMRYTEREFAPNSTSATRTFEAEIVGQTWVSLAPYDVQSVSSVQIDTDVSAITLGSAEYRLWPQPAADGVYSAIRLMPLSMAVTAIPWRHRQIQITGVWGFPAVPVDVQHWTLVTVTEWMRKDVAAFSTTYSLAEDKVDRPEMIPSAARAGLDLWKRDVIQ